MNKITIYQFTMYDISTDAEVKSRRWATREAITHANGTILEETATEVEETKVRSDIEGMTTRGFSPKHQPGLLRVPLSGI